MLSAVYSNPLLAKRGICPPAAEIPHSWKKPKLQNSNPLLFHRSEEAYPKPAWTFMLVFLDGCEA
jgi:hypothetical protein